MAKINKLNESLIDVTKHLPVCIGSVFKVDSLNYPNWGFKVTDGNIDAIKKRVEFYYKKDYAERRLNRNIEYILKTSFKMSQEERMAEFIAVTVREMMRSRDDGKREFHICDVPARDGHLSAAIAHALLRDSETKDLLSRTVFHLVDVSWQKLERAEETLRQFRGKSGKCPVEDEVLFRQLDSGTYDFIVTLGHLHHKPFLVEYFRELNRVLADDGAFVSADWHSPLSSYPAHVLTLLQNLGVEPARLDMFRSVMAEQLASPRKLLAPDEMESLLNHISHWKNVMLRLGETAPSLMPRLYVNAAYDTSRERQKKLEDADFSVDMAAVKKAFPKAKLPQFSDLPQKIAAKRLVAGSDSATVMAAVKKR
jgi:SAM-dependent methyltransferase